MSETEESEFIHNNVYFVDRDNPSKSNVIKYLKR